jgi:hypothetical protein
MPVVFGAIAAAGALGSLFGGIFGGSAKKDAMYAGAQLTDEQAQETELQTREQVRRFDLESGQKIGGARAAVGASGFASGDGMGHTTGSMNKYVDFLSSELGKESSWMLRSGLMSAEFQRKAADVQRQSADAGLWGDALSGVSGFLGGLGNAGNIAFGKP